jgi:UDP-2-acetamido-2-deoxy-ribo-hexuluronate aminotransferase
MQFIDVAQQYQAYRSEIDAAIADALLSGRYVMGPEVAACEERLKAHSGRSHVITCGSGTDALLMALMALEIGPGDEVITVPYTWISSAEVIELVRATTVLVDIEPATFTMDPAALEAAITPRTKAIIPVSLFGQPADMGAINAIAERHGIAVIEDAAQSYGAQQNGRRSGNLSAIGCTSFFPTKPLSCFGEGGAIFVDDDELAMRLRAIRVHGQRERGLHEFVGLNGRFETLQAAILQVKLDHFDQEVQARAEIGARYGELLSGVPEVTPPPIAAGNTHVYAQYTLRAERRDALRAFLQERDIPTAIYYTVCVHQQPAFARYGFRDDQFPVCLGASAEAISLPMHAFLTAQEQQQVADAICAFYQR